MISFQCPHCDLQLNVEDQYGGRSGPCRQCGQTVTIPQADSTTASDQVLDAQPVSDGLPPQLSVPQRVQPMRQSDFGCPKCGSDSVMPGAWPWYLGTIGALIVVARKCNQCGHEFDARKPTADFARRKLILALVLNGIGALGILAVIGLVVFAVIQSAQY